MNNNKSIDLIVVSSIILFFAGCLGMFLVLKTFPFVVTKNITKVEKDVTVNENGIADAVDKVIDSVVIITTYKNDEIVSSGTGFIYKKEGKKYSILTNYHVIEKGNKVTATFKNDDVIETTIVGHNNLEDIALLSFESEKEYKISSIGSSDASRVGDTVFTVGAPLDNVYSWTVTRGIISGKDRMVEVSTNNTNQADYVMKVMQTDAAINSGNSGGPLCNSNGEVIGINSLKLVSSGIEGMGFAIPIENAIKTADRILNNETYVTPFLGVSMLDVSTAYIQYYDVISKANLTKGVIVVDVSKNSPAEKSGLKSKDIIVKINNVEIKNVAYLRYTLYQYKIGDKITITYYRDGELKTTDVVLKSSGTEA